MKRLLMTGLLGFSLVSFGLQAQESDADMASDLETQMSEEEAEAEKVAEEAAEAAGTIVEEQQALSMDITRTAELRSHFENERRAVQGDLLLRHAE